MFLGKGVRLKRLTDEKSGKMVAITMDHAMGRGLMPGLNNIEETLAKIVEGRPNAVTMHKGLAETALVPYAGKVSLILKSTTFAPYHFNEDIPVADVEEAIRLGADAISVGLILGGPEQKEQIKHLAKISKIASSYGMPLVAHAYPRGSEIKDPGKYADYAVRVAAELGVDIIKTNWNGSTEKFAKAVQAASTSRVVIAGGAGSEDLESYLRMTEEALQAGVFGVTFGRFIFQNENPVAAINAVKAMVHDGKSAKQALDLYNNFRF